MPILDKLQMFNVQDQVFVLSNDQNYCMYIDADFDKRTAFGGIDYKLEIAWNNNTKSWTKILEKWSPNGDTKTIMLCHIGISSDYPDFELQSSGFNHILSDLPAYESFKSKGILNCPGGA